jgi:hypothetical protein
MPQHNASNDSLRTWANSLTPEQLTRCIQHIEQLLDEINQEVQKAHV